MSKPAVPQPQRTQEYDPSVNLLLEKYKLLRAEALENSAKNNQQVAYIQAYGLFLFFVTGAFFNFTTDLTLSKLPENFRLPLLVVAASLLFYFYSQVYLSSFSFRILRKRMSELELEINNRTSEPLLKYESSIAPKYFGQLTIDGNRLLPNFWLQFFTLVLFGAAVFLLTALAQKLLSGHPISEIFFIGSLIFFSWRLVWENFTFSFPGAISFNGNAGVTLTNWMKASRLASYPLNYAVVLALTFMAFINQLNDPLSAYFFVQFNSFYSSLLALDHSSIAIWTAIYTALCGIVPLPTPSELPLAFIPVVGAFPILLASAIGKAVGSTILFLASHLYFKFNRMNIEGWRTSLEVGPAAKLIKFGGLDAMFVISQLIPLAPMRSATIGYAAVTPIAAKSLFVVALGSAVGTISRMLIIGAIIAAGSWALPIPSGTP